MRKGQKVENGKNDGFDSFPIAIILTSNVVKVIFMSCYITREECRYDAGMHQCGVTQHTR